MRFLIAIASYGRRNLPYLERVIERYHGMSLDVHIVVFSEAPKDLGPRVRVVTGLPSCNPWSLPFAHKALFAQEVEAFDLFAYSEDDMEVTEENIRAFLELTNELDPSEVAGFLRYEVDSSGRRCLPDIHRSHHWHPGSVRRRGREVVAEFSNEHSAFYLLTQGQLRRAIASGGFLRPPYEGRYDMLCTAATDPYTSCGFRKVICVSSVERFLIHHLPDTYAGLIGLSWTGFRDQIKTLMLIENGRHPNTVLCGVETRVPYYSWWKSYQEKPSSQVLSLVPARAARVLSIGCGCGALEAQVSKRGAAVTALPLDSVIGRVAARKGIAVVYGSLDECLLELVDTKFDSVLIIGLLHLWPDHARVLERCCRLLAKGGTIVLGGPNFARIPLLMQRAAWFGPYGRLRVFAHSGVSVCGPASLGRRLRRLGMCVTAVKWLAGGSTGDGIGGRKSCSGPVFARQWLLQATRMRASAESADEAGRPKRWLQMHVW